MRAIDLYADLPLSVSSVRFWLGKHGMTSAEGELFNPMH
jgi:hypothetical protein